MRMGPHNVDNVNMTSEHRTPDADKAPPDRRYHHGNLRSALIEAGLAALEQGDTAELSLRAVARSVGVSANAAYRHFADKDALLSALAAEGFRRFAARQAEAAASSTDPTQARTASGRAYIGFAQDHPALFRLMFSHFLIASANPELQQTALEAFQGLIAATAKEAGTAPDDERTMLAAVARWSLVHGLSHLILDGQLAPFAGQVDHLIDGVLKLKPPA